MAQATIQNNEIIFLKFSFFESGQCYKELWVTNQNDGTMLATTDEYLSLVQAVNIVKVGSSPDDTSPIMVGDTVQFQIGNNSLLNPVMIGFLGNDYATFGPASSQNPGRTRFIIRSGPNNNTGMVGPGQGLTLERSDVPKTFWNVQSDNTKIYYKGSSTPVQFIPLRQYSFHQLNPASTCNDCSFCSRLDPLTTFSGMQYQCDGNGNCQGYKVQGTYDQSTARWCNAVFQPLGDSFVPYDSSPSCCATTNTFLAKSLAAKPFKNPWIWPFLVGILVALTVLVLMSRKKKLSP